MALQEELIKVELQSGAKLEINPAKFAQGKELYKAVVAEVAGIRIQATDDLGADFFKTVFFSAMASDKIEARLWECMEKVTYNGVRVTPGTFEPLDARADYLDVCAEVARVNLTPFTRNLFARFKDLYAKMQNVLQSELKTTTS